ncbi:MAG: hypothetical protein ACE5GH_01720, partial [Fidelibacterota bacterium]
MSTSRLNYVVAAIIILSFGQGCSKEESRTPLPQAIHGMSLERQLTGAEAKARIGRLHGKEVAPVASYVGHYGAGPDHAMLYLSKFASEMKAQDMLRKMSESIGEGSSGFGHHTKFAVKNRDIHLVLGQGQVHYFFPRGKYLYWLAINTGMARFA